MKNNNLKFLLIFALLGILLSILLLPIFPESPKNGGEFYTIAQTLVNKLQYSYRMHSIAPGYVAFLAIIYKIFGHNYNIIFILQFMLLGFISFFTFFIAKNYFKLPRYLSFLSGLLVLGWPYFVYFSMNLFTEVFFTFLLIFTVLLFFEFIKKPNKKQALYVGILLSATTLTRPIGLLLPFWFLFFWLICSFVRDNNFKLLISNIKKYYTPFIFIIFILLLTPWIAFVSCNEGRFVLIASNAKDMLGSNTSYYHEYKHYKTPGYEPGAEITADKLILGKIRSFARFWKSGIYGDQYDGIKAKHPIINYGIIFYRIVFYSIVLLAFSSLFYIKKNKYIALSWLIISYFWFFYGFIFHSYPRYTLPIIPIVIILAFYPLNEIIKTNAYFAKSKK